MKLLPFAVIYGGTLTSQALLSSLTTLHVGLVSELNLQIAEVNANFALYGFGATPNIPNIPAIPTPASTAPNGIAYFQSALAGKDTGPSTSFLLIDAYTANGYADPASPLDVILTDVNLVALLAAARTLRANITTQPTAAVTIDHAAAGNLGTVVAAGVGNTFQWQRSALGVGAWTDLTNVAPFSNVATATLTITNPTVLANNQDKYRVRVKSTGAGPVYSTVSTLTVT